MVAAGKAFEARREEMALLSRDAAVRAGRTKLTDAEASPIICTAFRGPIAAFSVPFDTCPVLSGGRVLREVGAAGRIRARVPSPWAGQRCLWVWCYLWVFGLLLVLLVLVLLFLSVLFLSLLSLLFLLLLPLLHGRQSISSQHVASTSELALTVPARRGSWPRQSATRSLCTAPSPSRRCSSSRTLRCATSCQPATETPMKPANASIQRTSLAGGCRPRRCWQPGSQTSTASTKP